MGTMSIPQRRFKPRIALCQVQVLIGQERPQAPHGHWMVLIQELSSPLSTLGIQVPELSQLLCSSPQLQPPQLDPWTTNKFHS